MFSIPDTNNYVCDAESSAFSTPGIQLNFSTFPVKGPKDVCDAVKVKTAKRESNYVCDAESSISAPPT
eukprot:370873-Lingulodinium_polyedra.AAC.1